MLTKEEDCCLELVVRGKREFGFDEENFEKLEIGVGACKLYCKGVLRVQKIGACAKNRCVCTHVKFWQVRVREYIHNITIYA